MKKRNVLVVIIISIILIVLGIYVGIKTSNQTKIDNTNQEYNQFMKENKYIKSFLKTKRISEGPCYKTKPKAGIFGEISHDYYNQKVKNCTKTEYRGIADNKYYTYFVITRGKTKTVKESFASQDKYFSTANTIVNKLGVSNEIKDMYVSGIPDYAIKGNEFPSKFYGNVATIIIYVKKDLKTSLNQEIFNEYMLVNQYLEEEDMVDNVYIQYEDGYKIQFDGVLGLELYKNEKLVLDSNREYSIEHYDELVQRLSE